jgi:hypothetical protein
LYFLIGSLVALALMGFAGWYFYSKWEANTAIMGQLDEQYAKLKRLQEQNPHPGSDKVDNIQAAKEQQKHLRAWGQKACAYFQRIPPIPMPESGKVTSREFSDALSRTIDQLQRQASAANVALPPKSASGQTYSFSFEGQRSKLAFATGSLEPLSVQLGEIKAVCDVLFQARINALDGLQRERISEDDARGPLTDYTSDKSVTNELAVLTPYEVTFRCFSSELASVLAGFASTPSGIIVKSINVEPAPAAAVSEQTPAAAAVYAPPVQAYIPPPPPPMAERRGPGGPADRYGMEGGRRYSPPPVAQPAYVYAPPVAGAKPRGGLPTVLDEKQLKVTLVLVVVKLTCPK